MDGSGVWKLGLILLLAAGCQHQVMTVPNSRPLDSSNKSPTVDPSQIKPATAKSKDLPPLVWVSSGDFKAGEASAPDVSPDRRQHIRELARADYQQALKLDPKCVPAYQGLARLYSSMRETPLAIETYHKALTLAPNNAALWYELGMCHHSRKDLGPALESVSRAAKIDPVNRTFINAMGVVLAETGRYDESLQCFIRSGGEAMGYYRLARTLQRLQRPELGERYLQVALEKDPSLASSMAPPSGGSGAPASTAAVVQQTAYHAPASTDPNGSAVPIPPAPPRVLSMESSKSYQTPEQVLLPPPPPVNVQYGQP